MAACTSRAAASMLRFRSNCRVILVDPRLLDEVISVTDAMRGNWRSSGVATDEAMVSGLAPGKPACTEIVGKSTCGRGDTGNIRKATAPASPMATVSKVVATGRLLKTSDIFMVYFSGARFSVPPWASAHGSAERAEARSSTLKRAPHSPFMLFIMTGPLPRKRLRARRDLALARFLARAAPGSAVEPQVNARGCIQSERLAENQSADHGDTQRAAQFRTGAAAKRQRHGGQQRRHGGHHDGTEAQQARLVNRIHRRHAFLALGVQGEIDHHDSVLLHDADEQDDADQRDDAEILVEQR